MITDEYIIFTNSPQDANLTNNFIILNKFLNAKTKASPNFNSFLHIFRAKSMPMCYLHGLILKRNTNLKIQHTLDKVTQQNLD